MSEGGLHPRKIQQAMELFGAALSHIVEFSAGVRRNGPLCVEIDGLTIDRLSVGKPR
jgi:hypothetical protein